MDHDDGMDFPPGHEPGHDPSLHDPSAHDPSLHDPALAEADTADLTGTHAVAGPPEDDFGFDDADSYGPAAGHGHDHGLPDEQDLAHGHEGSEGDLDADLAAGLDHHDAHPAPGSNIDAPDDDEEEPRHDDSHLDEAPDQSHLFADTDTPVGADPDADHVADDPSWHDEPFPPVLDLDTPPEPVDGFPWSDPDTLGDDDAMAAHLYPTETPPVHDLLAYDGMDAPPPGTDPWQALIASDDPATSTLARWWAPGA